MASKLRLLVVDDEEAIVFAMQRYFTARGFEVDTASEIEEAEALLANVHYQAAIIDLRLTGVHGAEGLDILGFVRDNCPGTRTILLTAYGSADLSREARERGADVVLSKPQPLPDVAQVLMGLVGEGR
jgi:ActR/RegA family two-component response regulator